MLKSLTLKSISSLALYRKITLDNIWLRRYDYSMDISFIVPAYNEEAILGKCLEAIFAELKNNPAVLAEVIVVNNASTDNTKQVAASFSGVKIVDEDRKGLVFARAAGAAVANGELLAHIDSDCNIPKGWLKTVMAEFAAD